MNLNPLIVDALGERPARLYELLKVAHAEAKADEKITLKSLCERFGWKSWHFQRDLGYLYRTGWIEPAWRISRYHFTHWVFPAANDKIIERSREFAMWRQQRCKPKF